MCCAVIVSGFGLGVDQENVAGISIFTDTIDLKWVIYYSYYVYTI